MRSVRSKASRRDRTQFFFDSANGNDARGGNGGSPPVAGSNETCGGTESSNANDASTAAFSAIIGGCIDLGLAAAREFHIWRNLFIAYVCSLIFCNIVFALK